MSINYENNNITGSGSLFINNSGNFVSGLYVNSVPVSLSGHTHLLKIGDGSTDQINYLSSDRLNVIGTGGTLVLYNDDSNTITISGVPNLTDVVFTTGNQNISGIKTFLNNIVSSGQISAPTGRFDNIISDIDFTVNGTMNINAAASITANGPITFVGNPYVVSGAGYFTSGLFVGPTGSATPVSLSGHHQPYSTIDNFCTGVAECVNTPLLAGTGISLSYVNGTGLYINASGGIQIDSSSSGFVVKTGINNYTTRYISNGNNINISYADGVSGNPTIGLSGNLDLIQNITSTGNLRANSGIFSSGITLNGTGVSLTGHTHTASNITNFNSSVSGLLPVGTTNYLSKFGTGGSGLSNSLVFDNGTNIGIGTASPSNRLEVAGGDVLIGPSDNTRQLSFFNNSYGIKVQGGLEIFTGDVIRFRKGSTEYARIDTNGKVGIGTTSPAANLHVIGSGFFASGLTVTGLLTSNSGNFINSLQLNGSGVSVTGHSHTVSDISNFGSGVSGLLPVKDIIAGSGIQVASTSGIYTITAFGVAASSASSLITKADNKTGSTISKMSVVYINGGHGNRPTIQKSIASAESTSSKTYGITASNINDNETGDIVVFGSLIDVDTNQFGALEGSALYLSPSVSGGITATKPLAPNHLVTIGKIVRNHSNQGIIEVSIQNGFELYELHDVAVTGATNGQFLQYNSNSGLWIPSSSGNFTSLNVNGSGSFSNNITASGFIKSGGTSSQFLKADGSVDSTTYLYNDNTIVRTTGDQFIAGDKNFWGSNYGISVGDDHTVIKLADNMGPGGSGIGLFDLQSYGDVPLAAQYWNGTNNIIHYAYGGGTLASPRIAILENNGNVGIGTSSPSAKLHVDGSINVSNGAINVNDNSVYGTVLYSSGLKVFNNTIDVEVTQVDNNLGGYDFTPSGFLTVNGFSVLDGGGPAIFYNLPEDGDIVLFSNFENPVNNGIYRLDQITEYQFKAIRATSYTNGISIPNGYRVKIAEINNSARFVLNRYSDGNSIIGTDSLIFEYDAGEYVMTIQNSLDVDFTAAISAKEKYFKIQHPNPDSGYSFLQYGSLESPYHGVRLTGKDKLKNGICEILLPDYLKYLIHEEDVSIQLTNYGHHKILYVDKIDLKNNKFIVKGYRSKSGGPFNFYWSFTGIRKDVPNLISEQ